MEVKIRPARPGDGEGIARAHLDSGRTYSDLDPSTFHVPQKDGLAEWTESFLREGPPPGHHWTVAVAEGSVVGYAEAHVEEPRDDAHRQIQNEFFDRRVSLDALAVAEAWRRHGIGTRLVREVEAWAREQGAARVFLDTWAESPMSVPFYKSLGYRARAINFDKRL